MICKMAQMNGQSNLRHFPEVFGRNTKQLETFSHGSQSPSTYLRLRSPTYKGVPCHLPWYSEYQLKLSKMATLCTQKGHNLQLYILPITQWCSQKEMKHQIYNPNPFFWQWQEGTKEQFTVQQTCYLPNEKHDPIYMIGIISLWYGSGQIFFILSEQECCVLNMWASLNTAIGKMKNI